MRSAARTRPPAERREHSLQLWIAQHPLPGNLDAWDIFWQVQQVSESPINHAVKATIPVAPEILSNDSFHLGNALRDYNTLTGVFSAMALLAKIDLAIKTLLP